MNPLRLGIDFDNTIVCYDDVFYKAALEKNLVSNQIKTSKSAVRDYLRSVGKEEEWTELQGYVYGARMELAQPFPGIEGLLSVCRSNNIPTYIISHKTLHPFLGPKYNLHQAAKNWILTQPFLKGIDAFFELTLEDKLRRIALQKCNVFIDDLPELLEEKRHHVAAGKCSAHQKNSRPSPGFPDRQRLVQLPTLGHSDRPAARRRPGLRPRHQPLLALAAGDLGPGDSVRARAHAGFLGAQRLRARHALRRGISQHGAR